MKLFGITFGERKADTGSSREEVLALLGGLQSASKSGAAVNYKTAAEVGAAIGCARVIAEGLSQVPFKLFKEAGTGGRQPAKDHPLYKLMSRRANAWQTSFEFREMIALHLVFCGNAYIYVSRSGGRVLELLPFQPQHVTVKRNGWQVEYEITTDKGARVPVSVADMWHLRGPSWDGVLGLDVVKYAREAIGLALATEEHGARMFSNGARVGGILSSESSLKEDQVKLLRESWERTQGGVSNAFKTAILWGGLKWSPMAMPNTDAQMIEQRRFQVEEICRHFRVMPIMVGYSDKTATYASAEQMFLAHVVHTLGPWYARIEQSAEANLLTEAERDAGYYFKFIAAGLMRGAHSDRAAYFSKALGAGGSPAWMTQDEVRELEELNPMGGDAAELPVATNVGGTPSDASDASDAADAAAKTAAALVEMKSLAQTIAALADRPAPSYTFKAGDTHFNPQITNALPPATAPDVKVDVNVPATAPPVINVVPSEVKVDVAAPIVNLEATLAQPTEMTMHILSMPARATESKVERDADKNIVKTMQVEKDA